MNDPLPGQLEDAPVSPPPRGNAQQTPKRRMSGTALSGETPKRRMSAGASGLQNARTAEQEALDTVADWAAAEKKAVERRVAEQKDMENFRSAKLVRRSSVSGGFEFRRLEAGGSHLQECRFWAHRLLSSQRFDAAMGCVILLNSIMIGLEAESELVNGDLRLFRVFEQFFLVTYVVEIGLRLFAHRWACLESGWVRFDAALVSLGVLSWLAERVIEGMSDQEGNAGLQDAMAPLMVLRVLRLLRLARAVRLLVQFRMLWMLVRGLLSSAGTMWYTFVLMNLMLYLFACAAVELITKNDRGKLDSPNYDLIWRETIDEYWSGILSSMQTLMQFAILDSIRDAYMPLIMQSPGLVFFFILFVLAVSVSLMNLVTAVIVEGSLEQAKLDHEAKKAHQIAQMKLLEPKIRDLFHDLDTDDSGTITKQEVAEAEGDVRAELMQVVQAETLEELFEMLDVDGSGEVDIDEFVSGIVRLVTTEQPVEFIRILKQLHLSRKQTSKLQEDATEAQLRASCALEAVGMLEEHMVEQLSSLEDRLARQLDDLIGKHLSKRQSK